MSKDSNQEVFHKTSINWDNPTYENHSQPFINKDFFLHLLLNFIAKKWLKIQNNRGNSDLWKTNISDKGDDKIGKRFNNKK